MEIDKKSLAKYSFAALFIAILAGALFIFLPYLSAVLTGVVFAYILFPVHRFLNEKIKLPGVSAFVVAAVAILLIIIPLGFLVFEASKQADTGYLMLKQAISSESLRNLAAGDGFIGNIAEILNHPDINLILQESLGKISAFVSTTAASVVFSVPKKIAELFVSFVVMFFALRDGKQFFDRIKNKIPLENSHKNKIFREIHNVLNAVIYGVFVVSIMEGVVGGIAFALAGISAPILWGIILFIIALVPMIGATIVWVPAMIISFFAGNIVGGVLILLGGAILSSMDFFLKPKVIGDRSAVHPLVVFIGFLGGVPIFGFIGVVAGPLVLSLLLVMIEIMEGEFK